MSPQSTSRSTITGPFSRLTPPRDRVADAVTAYPAVGGRRTNSGPQQFSEHRPYGAA
jgi:hypothetical protein